MSERATAGRLRPVTGSGYRLRVIQRFPLDRAGQNALFCAPRMRSRSPCLISWLCAWRGKLKRAHARRTIRAAGSQPAPPSPAALRAAVTSGAEQPGPDLVLEYLADLGTGQIRPHLDLLGSLHAAQPVLDEGTQILGRHVLAGEGLDHRGDPFAPLVVRQPDDRAVCTGCGTTCATRACSTTPTAATCWRSTRASVPGSPGSA